MLSGISFWFTGIFPFSIPPINGNQGLNRSQNGGIYEQHTVWRGSPPYSGTLFVENTLQMSVFTPCTLQLAIMPIFCYNRQNPSERQVMVMDQIPTETPQQPPVQRRRRKRSKWQDFKEAYLPVIILAVTALLVIAFIAGAVSRALGDADETKSTEQTEDPAIALQKEAEELMARAAEQAAIFDYAGALDTLSDFSGDMTTITGMVDKYNEYNTAYSQLVPFTDIENIPHLSTNMLIADLDRALADPDYGSQFNRNYITTEEFSAILQQLYDNNYMLVSLYDIVPEVTTDGVTALEPATLYLPAGKKPIVLTQTAVNYFTYIVDSDGDGLADPGGAGFASRLVLDENGELTCEMVNAEGQTVTGDFDLIPILNKFIDEHPDFSYLGARATIAVTGYDGLFGYRTDPETVTKISQEYYDKAVAEVKPIIEALREEGYDIACYTYDMASYGSMSASEIAADLELWKQEVTPLLGSVDILVYPYGSDIGDTGEYSGDRYELLKEFGFKYFIGQDSATKAWGQITDDYARQTRRQITGALMAYSYSYYEDLFDASNLLDARRGEIPN